MESILALSSSALWGTSDFFGGLVSKRRPPLAVVGYSQSFGLIVMCIAATITNSWGSDPAYIPWAIMGSACGIAGLLAFYTALARGRMGIVAPIAACGVIVPVAVGIVGGDVPSWIQGVGIVAALVGVVCATGPELRGAGDRRSIVLAGVSGVLFGLVFVAIAQGAQFSAVMTVTAMRVVAVIVLVSIAICVRSRGRVTRSDLPIIALVGAFDALANVFLGVATEGGNLTIASVLGSLYPIVTILLALFILNERLRRIQYVGVALALIGVVVISAASA